MRRVMCVELMKIYPKRLALSLPPLSLAKRSCGPTAATFDRGEQGNYLCEFWGVLVRDLVQTDASTRPGGWSWRRKPLRVGAWWSDTTSFLPTSLCMWRVLYPSSSTTVANCPLQPRVPRIPRHCTTRHSADEQISERTVLACYRHRRPDQKWAAHHAHLHVVCPRRHPHQ